MSNPDARQDEAAAAASPDPATKQDAGARVCAECKTVHCEPAGCSNCGACLYKNSTQVKDDTYPLFRCTVCQQVNFWD